MTHDWGVRGAAGLWPINKISIYAEGASAYQFEDEVSLTYQNSRFLEPKSGYDVSIVQTGKDKIVARIGVSIDARVDGEFSFAVYDSTDRDYVPMGVSSAETSGSSDSRPRAPQGMPDRVIGCMFGGRRRVGRTM